MERNPEKLFTRLKVIGKGSFGEVFKAINNETKEIVAIKELNMESEDDDIEEMQKEIALLSHCDCDNITKYYGSYLVGFKLWIVMDYCSIGSIRTLMKSGPIPEKHIAIISRDVLNALHYLHRNNIIHRDIKAANILMTENGVAKLCDFGVAGQISYSNLKRTSFVGTPYWMAPEVIKRSGYNHKADIWSFGITVYEMAVGHPPHIELDPMKAILKIPKAEPPRLEGNNFSKILKDFVAVCLNDDPESRPNTDELMLHKFIKQVKKGSRELMELIYRHQDWLSRHTENDNEKMIDSRKPDSPERDEEGWDFETVKYAPPTDGQGGGESSGSSSRSNSYNRKDSTMLRAKDNYYNQNNNNSSASTPISPIRPNNNRMDQIGRSESYGNISGNSYNDGDNNSASSSNVVSRKPSKSSINGGGGGGSNSLLGDPTNPIKKQFEQFSFGGGGGAGPSGANKSTSDLTSSHHSRDDDIDSGAPATLNNYGGRGRRNQNSAETSLREKKEDLFKNSKIAASFVNRDRAQYLKKLIQTARGEDSGNSSSRGASKRASTVFNRDLSNNEANKVRAIMEQFNSFSGPCVLTLDGQDIYNVSLGNVLGNGVTASNSAKKVHDEIKKHSFECLKVADLMELLLQSLP